MTALQQSCLPLRCASRVPGCVGMKELISSRRPWAYPAWTLRACGTPHSRSTRDLVELFLPSYSGMLWKTEGLKIDNIKPQCFQLQNLIMDRPFWRIIVLIDSRTYRFFGTDADDPKGAKIGRDPSSARVFTLSQHNEVGRISIESQRTMLFPREARLDGTASSRLKYLRRANKAWNAVDKRYPSGENPAA